MKLTTYIKEDLLFLSGLILSLIADVAIGVHTYSEVLLGRWNETFSIGFVSIPKFLAPGATNLGVALLISGVFVALIIGMIFRYRYYRDELQLMKKADISRKRSGFFQGLGDDDDF